MVMFRVNICQDSEKTKISNLMYKLLYLFSEENEHTSPWLNHVNCVKTILKDCGFPGIWGNQVIPCSKECFKKQI